MSFADKKQALSQGKYSNSSSKTPLPKEKKDTTAFRGDSLATYGEKLTWLRQNKDEVFRITHGRVKESSLKEYAKYLGTAEWAKYMEKSRREPTRKERIETATRRAINKAKTDVARFDTREDIKVAKKMYGLEKK